MSVESPGVGGDRLGSRAWRFPRAVRELALHPFRELRVPPGFERIECDEFLLVLNPYPSAQVVEPLGVTHSTVPRSVEAARRIAKERGKSLLVWWVSPDRRDLEQPLLDAGLVHEDTPGFEAVENAMAILQAPRGQAAAGVSVKQTETYEEYAAAEEIVMTAFDYPEAMRAEVAAELPKRWARLHDALEPRPPVHRVDRRPHRRNSIRSPRGGRRESLRGRRTRGSSRTGRLQGAHRRPLGSRGRTEAHPH